MALRDIFRRKPEPVVAPVQRREGPIERLIRSGNLEEAERRLWERVRLYPKSQGTRLKLADLLARMGRTSAAVVEYLAVAEGWLETERYDRAIATVRTALRLEPDNEAVKRRLDGLQRVQASLSRRDLHVKRLERRDPAGVGDTALSAETLRALWPSLGTSFLIADLDDDPLTLFFGIAEVERLSPGASLAREGQTLPRCYILASGKVEESAGDEEGEARVLRHVGPGAVIGAETLLEDGPWPASYRTTSEATVLRLTRRGVERIPESDRHREALLDTLRRHGRAGQGRPEPTD